MKVRLVRGVIWKDKESGFSIRKGEVKEADDEVIKRAGNRLQVLVNLEEKEEVEENGE